MIKYIHSAKTLSKKLSALRQTGKKGAMAADLCEKILEELHCKGVRHPAVYQKRTKNGEGRIRNCVKYDLGHGYRLVTVRSGTHLFVPFIGGHDEVSLWLEKHKFEEFDPENPLYEEYESNPSCSSDNIEGTACSECVEPDLYEAELATRLNDTLLKEIFRGLFRSA